MAQATGESAAHRELKRLALVWAQAHGFEFVAIEVRLPRSGFRADVAACMSHRADAAQPGETAVFECKQARADLLRDTAPERETAERLREVAARRRDLERLLGLHLPNLRRGESLFAECDAYDLDAIRHDGWRAVRREEAVLLAKLYGRTKFARVRRYGCADRFYLVVSPGVLEPHEAPAGWGVLVQDADALTLARAPERVDSGPAMRLAMLQAVARSGTRAVNTQAGVAHEAVQRLRQDLCPP